ncbi:MAG: DegV family protein [Clostridia bacterium]|nr:DegV family protein [Clostridia bacterium]
MKNYAIVADSTCDLTLEIREKYDIDYIKMGYVIDDVTYPASLDWESHSAHDFYELMRGGKYVRTVQIAREDTIAVFKKHLDLGEDIIYISCSSALSGSYNFGSLIARELREEYPQSNIVCVDSLISSLGQGFLAIKAAEMRGEGASLDETVAWLLDNRLRVNQYGTVESLEYLRRVGRVKASSAFFGNLFGVKPIILSDVKGQNFAFKKVKGAANARGEIASLIAESAENIEDSCLYISHADDLPAAEALRDKILAIAPFKEVIINHIAPIVGASVGPGTVIAFCFGATVTVEGN